MMEVFRTIIIWKILGGEGVMFFQTLGLQL